MGIPRDAEIFVIKLRFSQGSTPKIAQTKTMGGHFRRKNEHLMIKNDVIGI